MRNFEIELALLLNKLNSQSEQSSGYLKKCGLLLDREFERLLNLDEKKQLTLNEFQSYLVEAELAPERISELVKIYESMSRLPELSQFLIDIEEFLMWEPKIDSPEQVYLLSKDFRDKVELQTEGYFKKLAEIVLAIKINNEAWAKSQLIEFFNYHPARLGFDVHRQIFNDEWTKERHEKLILNLGLEITKYFKKKYPEEMDIFMTLMKQTGDSRVFSSLYQNFGTDWSLSRLREAVEKGQRSKQYPSFWFSQLSNRTSSGQIDLFLRELFAHTSRYPLSPEALWIFVENFPSNPDEREQLARTSLQAESTYFYFSYIIFHLLEHESFKKIMSSKDERYTRPLFQLKRQLLREGLKSLKAPELMLFELIKIGDYQRDYLWYIALSPQRQILHEPQK